MELGPLSILIRKLLSHSLLSTADQEAIAALPHKIKTPPPGGSILREGDQAEICPILLSGFAYRQKVASDGGRQIVALKLPGDALDLQSLYLQKAYHDVRMLTPAELALVPLAAIEQLTIHAPGGGARDPDRHIDRIVDQPRMVAQHRATQCARAARASALRASRPGERHRGLRRAIISKCR